MNSKVILLVINLFVTQIFSQTISLKGVVRDSLQKPLSYANIIAKTQSTSKNIVFAISDEEGRYKINLHKGLEYSIKVTFIGFIPQTRALISSTDTVLNFSLKESKNILEEVVIELPVQVKEDTISYITSKFTNGKERKLKNILKKLPGIEVNKKGQVTVMGKKVATLLVDNKPFFGGNTKLGVENIPADAVDGIEAINNYNSVSFLKNVSGSDKMALNIKLKKAKKNFVFGDVEVGKGNQDFYKIHASTFYYAPKTNINFIGNLNNFGEQTLTFKDYMNFSGGINAVFSGNFNFKGGDFRQFLESDDVLKTNRQFTALNITQAVSNKMAMSGYAILSKTANESYNTVENKYNVFTENQENKSILKNTFGIAKVNLNYKPNINEQWYFKTQFKRTDNFNENKVNSFVNTKNNVINMNEDAIATNVNKIIEWHKKSSDKHTFSALANYIYDKNSPHTSWQTNNLILQGLIPFNASQQLFNFQQLKRNEKHYFNTTLKHFWVLHRNHHIYSTISNVYEEQYFNTNDFQVLDNGSANNFYDGKFNNNLLYTFHDFSLGVNYKFRTGIFTLNQGVNLHRYHWIVSQENNKEFKKWVVLPNFKGEIAFNKSKKIKLNYGLKTNFSDVSRLANRFYLQSYNSVFRGNENLENELFHNARISYNRFSMFRGLMLMLSADYTKKVKGYRNTVNFDGVNRFVSSELINNPSENWSTRINFSKRIKKIKYRFKGDYRSSTFLQNVNRKEFNNLSNNYSAELSLKTMFKEFPIIELGYKRSIGKYTSSNSKSTFTTNEPFLEVAYDFLDAFQFEFEYRGFDYKTKNRRNNYEMAETSLLYHKEDSPFTFKFTAKNLFNTTFKQSNSFSNYLISDRKTYIMPRVFMFSLGYKL